MVKTIYEISANITIIKEGNHAQTFTEEDRRKLSSYLKKEFGVDDIHIKQLKTFTVGE